MGLREEFIRRGRGGKQKIGSGFFAGIEGGIAWNARFGRGLTEGNEGNKEGAFFGRPLPMIVLSSGNIFAFFARGRKTYGNVLVATNWCAQIFKSE
jgi:hypothetical protein